MIGFVRALGAAALFVVMGLVSLVYAGQFGVQPKTLSGELGTFSPATAPPGGTVTLTGKAKPNSTRLAYFACNTGCEPIRISNMVADAQGQYSLTFNIPRDAPPGNGTVLFRLQRIPQADDMGGRYRRPLIKLDPAVGDNWNVSGLQVMPFPALSGATLEQARRQLAPIYKKAIGVDPDENQLNKLNEAVQRYGLVSEQLILSRFYPMIDHDEKLKRDIVARAYKQVNGAFPSNLDIVLQAVNHSGATLYDQTVQYLAGPFLYEATIRQSYRDAFGRDPRQEELNSWRSPNQLSLAQLVDRHRNTIKQNDYTRREIIYLSYKEALKRTQTLDEDTYWKKRLQGSGETYTELVEVHRKWLAQNPQTNHQATRRKLYTMDGTGSKAEHRSVMLRFTERFMGDKQYFPGVQDVPFASDAGGIYQAAYNQICKDVAPGGPGVTEVFLAGYSRGAMAAIRLANETRRSCGANVRFVGLVDAVNTSIYDWPSNLDSGVPVTIHLRKEYGEHVLTTADITGVTTRIHPWKSVNIANPGIRHWQLVCRLSFPVEKGARWTEGNLVAFAQKAGGQFAPEQPAIDCAGDAPLNN